MKKLAIAAAVGSFLAAGMTGTVVAGDMAARRSATASPRPARTTARPTATRARASRRRTTTRTSGSTCRRTSAKRWAARPHPARRQVIRQMGDVRTARFPGGPIPARAGIGLRSAHHDDWCAAPGRRLAGGPHRELFPRRRPASRGARAGARALSAQPARRRPGLGSVAPLDREHLRA